MRPPGVVVLLAVSTLKTSNRILAATALLWWVIRGNSGGNRGAAAHCLPNCRSKPLRQAAQRRHGFHPIEARMDRSASSDCSFLKKRRVERNPVRGDTLRDDVVKIFEIDPTSDSSPWGRRASASLQPGETTFDATKLHASSGEEKRRRAHRRFRSSSTSL
jgi:hypothetical protein